MRDLLRTYNVRGCRFDALGLTFGTYGLEFKVRCLTCRGHAFGFGVQDLGAGLLVEGCGVESVFSLQTQLFRGLTLYKLEAWGMEA